jgi:hypothetical protein
MGRSSDVRFASKADITAAQTNVRFVPKADILRRSKKNESCRVHISPQI